MAVDNFDEPHMNRLPDGPPPGQAPGSPLLDSLESSRLSQFFFDIEDNPDQSTFDEAMDGWNIWGTELPPELHSMTTSLSPPDVDATIRLHAKFTGTHHQDPGSERRLRATQSSKGYVEHPIDWTSPLPIEGAEPQRDFSDYSFLPQLGNPVYPSSVVDPKYLTDSRDISKTRGLASFPCFSSEDLSINQRSLEPTISAGAACFPQEALVLLPRHASSAGNEGLGSDTVHAKDLSPPSATMPFTGTPIYKYGNDNSFVMDRFYAPPHQKSEEEITQSSLNLLGCLERQESIPSPRLDRRSAHSSTHFEGSDMDHVLASSSISANESKVNETLVGTRPTKRRKVLRKERNASGPKLSSIPHRPRQKKLLKSKGTSRPRSSLGEEPCSSSPPRHSGDAKSSRQNLSSEQRRANHIGSEKQRRDSIQALEEELRKVVPVLQSSDFSKAEMLEQAGDWLESLLKGNGKLQARLDEKTASSSCKTLQPKGTNKTTAPLDQPASGIAPNIEDFDENDNTK